MSTPHRSRPRSAPKFIPFWLLPLLLVGGSLTGCHKEPSAVPVTAEFQDEHATGGTARKGDTIVVALKHPLPPEFPLEAIGIEVDPPVERWNWRLTCSEDRRQLHIEILTGSPAFRLDGIYGRDEGSTGLGLDLSGGAPLFVDLQPVVSWPILERVVWEDRPQPVPDRVVGQGDALRLVFDRPMRLRRPGLRGKITVTSRDIVLSKASDRLDDGVVTAYFEATENEKELRIILGSNPVLQVDGVFRADAEEIDRFGLAAPSGFALAGTRILPMPAIVDRRGGPGAVSKEELDIEFDTDFSRAKPQLDAVFPQPGNRMFHTVTPLDWTALLIGGQTVEGDEPRVLDQILLYDPKTVVGPDPFSLVGHLPQPTSDHTTTALPGPDEQLGTLDDIAVVIGGRDNDGHVLGAITVVRRSRSGEFQVFPLETSLLFPRAEHAAVAISNHEILVDGGIGPKDGDGPKELIESAERITLRLEGEKIGVERIAFRTLARMRHSLTLLPPSAEGQVFALAYGGLGRDRRRHPRPKQTFGERITTTDAADSFFGFIDASILVSPVLIDVQTPTRSIPELPYDFSFPLLRAYHEAAPVLDDVPVDGLPTAGRVLLVGGTSRHPLRSYSPGHALWEMPPLPRLPSGQETADAVLFRFNRANPVQSQLEVIPHPAPDPGQIPERVYFSALPVPGYGVVIAGGEGFGDWPDKPRSRSVDVFLAAEERLAPAAAWLQEPRARHQGYLVRGHRRILLLGGLTSDTAIPESPAAVEEIPLD